MSALDSVPTAVSRPELRAGEMLAEGGEGRVYELVGRPGTLYKAYRRPAQLAPLEALIAWEARLAEAQPELAARVRAATAWPQAVVTQPGAAGGTAAGLLLPRAPRRFAVRHRDGTSRLATLSYLTADPGQRAAAYGLALPAPVSADRIGIVYALARVLEAFQRAAPPVGHGDLSTRNILWSLERGPEVFLLDCDSCERYSPDGEALDSGHRRRAMTPNWDDPATPAGANPTLASDRYSLGLIFLRVVGAGHFPLQRRQRDSELLSIDFAIPPAARRTRSLLDGAVVWSVCARSLSTRDPARRPAAAEWVSALEEVLDGLGAMSAARAVWAAQGGGTPAPSPTRSAEQAADVRVRPVAMSGAGRRWERVRPPGPGLPALPQSTRPAPPTAAPTRTAAPAPLPAPPSIVELARTGLGRGGELWLGAHRATLASLSRAGRRRRATRQVIGCLVLDFALLAVIFYMCAMVAGVLLGI